MQTKQCSCSFMSDGSCHLLLPLTPLVGLSHVKSYTVQSGGHGGQRFRCHIDCV